jgi:hypothetical protein
MRVRLDIHWFHQWHPSRQVVDECVDNPAPPSPNLGREPGQHISVEAMG